MRPDKTKAEQRGEEKVIVTAAGGGGVQLCARRLCNVWHRFRVFAIFHGDKRGPRGKVTPDTSGSQADDNTAARVSQRRRYNLKKVKGAPLCSRGQGLCRLP